MKKAAVMTSAGAPQLRRIDHAEHRRRPGFMEHDELGALEPNAAVARYLILGAMRSILLCLALLSACKRSDDNPLAPLPAFEGFQLVKADRQRGSGGERLRVEGWVEVTDIPQARRSVDAYVAAIEKHGFRPLDKAWDEVLSCAADAPKGFAFGCTYEGARGATSGRETLTMIVKGVDTVRKSNGTMLGVGMAVDLDWTQELR